MAIRKGRVDDIPAFEYIDKLCFPKTIRYSRFDFLYYFFKKNVFTLVFEEDGRAQAFLIADLKSPTDGHIISIDVHPSFRRSGLGRKLMDEAERIFDELGIDQVSLEVHESNVIAQLFYTDMGYRLERKLFNYYHSGHGLRMAKSLKATKKETGAVKVEKGGEPEAEVDEKVTQTTLTTYQMIHR
jgi:ribosomal protein S18 acetylase RimI-like enzyme